MDSSITTQTLLIFLSFWGWVGGRYGGAGWGGGDAGLELTAFTQQAWELSSKMQISTATKLTFRGDEKVSAGKRNW